MEFREFLKKQKELDELFKKNLLEIDNMETYVSL